MAPTKTKSDPPVHLAGQEQLEDALGERLRPLVYIPLEQIRTGNNPREKAEEPALEALTESTRRMGVIQTVLVRRLEEEESEYELIAGERRYEASERAGRPVIPAMVIEPHETIDPVTLRAMAILENIQHVNLTPQLREQSMVQGTVDFISGHFFSSVLDLKARGVKQEDIVSFNYSDYKMDVYGNGIIVSPAFAEKPEVVKGFLRATAKAWKEVAANPAVGLAAVKKRDPLIDEKLEAERLDLSLKMNVLTPYVKANGMGDVDPARFARSVADVAEAFGLPAAPTPDKVFSNKFLPSKAERMVAP